MTKPELLADLRAIAGRLLDDNARKTAADAALLAFICDLDITDAWLRAGGAQGRHLAAQTSSHYEPFLLPPRSG